MNFWDFGTWTSVIQMGILFVAVIVGNTLRRKVPILRRTLIPTSVIAGILILIFKELGPLRNMIDNRFMEVITYHTLGIGFIAIALKTARNKEDSKKARTDVVNTGMLTVATYLLQAIIGLGITMGLAYTILPGLFKASGLILPLGFGQGPGQALNFGIIYEGLGFVGGPDFGLTIAAIGFLAACFAGVFYMNVILKKKSTTIGEDIADNADDADEKILPTEIPLTESIDKFTMQAAIVGAAYFITFLIMQGITYFIDMNYLGNFGINTLKPLIWGFNFLIGTLVAMLFKSIIKGSKKKNFMKRDYISNGLLNRIGGFVFDIMIVAAIAAIEIRALSSLVLPIVLMSIIGGVLTVWYVDKVCRKKFPTYWAESSVSMFGMLLGTASTGMILLREIDPGYKTPAATNLVLQSVPAIIFGFPMLLLLGYAPLGNTQAIITFVALIGLFIVMNLLLFRKTRAKAK